MSKKQKKFKPFEFLIPSSKAKTPFGRDKYQKIFLQALLVLENSYLCQEYYLSGTKFNVQPRKYPATEIEEFWKLR